MDRRIGPACAWAVGNGSPRQGTEEPRCPHQNISGAPRNRDAYPVGRQHRHSQPISAAKATSSTINVSSGTVMVAGSTRWRQRSLPETMTP